MRPAFTLIELLITVALTAILAALIATAILRAFSAAQRAECQNKLKQIGLLAHVYHDARHRFPHPFGDLDNPRGNWIAELELPEDAIHCPADRCWTHVGDDPTTSYLAVLGYEPPGDDSLWSKSLEQIEQGTSTSKLVGERPYHWPVGLAVAGMFHTSMYETKNALDAPANEFWSFHPGGRHWLYGDGHVEFEVR